MTAPETNSQTIATVERAIDVLVMFTRTDARTLGVTEIAAELGLSKAAVHRILASLRARGLITLDEGSRRYSLGPLALALGNAYQARVDVREAAAAELRALSAAAAETATLSVLAGEGRVYVDQVTPDREIVMSVPLGRTFPLHAGASSKALLAFLTDAEIERVLRRPREALTPATLVDEADLRAELARIRRDGYALSRGERQSGAVSVAAPVFDHTGRPVAAISICGPAERFTGSVAAVVPRLPEASARVSEALGHDVSGTRAGAGMLVENVGRG